jgi:glycosyltransferase involved in cell wall biosynthesis
MTPLRILFAHNAYAVRGGEDTCVDNEQRALRDAEHEVMLFTPRSEVNASTAVQALAAPWGGGAENDLEQLLVSWKPQILHAHNLMPLLSPRAFTAAHSLGIRVVATLHNFRPLCLNGLFLTPSGEVCRRCAPGSFLPGMIRGCYRNSRIQSTGMAVHQTIARWRGWYKSVDRFIAPSRFLREQFVAAGFPVDRFVVQGHFAFGTPPQEPSNPGHYLLYLGRLSEEKGIRWLIQAVQSLELRLVVAGSGPLEAVLRSRSNPRIEFRGVVKGSEKENLIRGAAAIVMASECFENFPMVILEANQAGVPVIVPAEGGMAELIKEGENGYLYRRHDIESFCDATSRVMASRDPMDLRRRALSYAKACFQKESWLRDRLQLYSALLS